MHSRHIMFNSHTDALLPPQIFPKDLNSEQLVMMLANHPIFKGTDYHHDIGRLKRMLYIMHNSTHCHNNCNSDLFTEVKLSGKDFLSLDEGSLEQLELSTEFQTPLMIIIEDLVCHQST